MSRTAGVLVVGAGLGVLAGGFHPPRADQIVSTPTGVFQCDFSGASPVTSGT